ncbi:cell wall hydrolase [Anaerobranca gottschalkii]|uniref:N-acetylmuramoyl-L-alanine amidase n=1 Tax=Anaerobranca gottschalkii DSM 13577 TaxID=1120990 RepID=A0A1H9YBR0_9FIRM|nr:cell wall hydrolase [Anaerobranca gottschalkii]SES66396.1 N-acetylmuramoyl-L-alanine amidase [Anaerobranca gottschalkii DSM 13577]
MFNIKKLAMGMMIGTMILATSISAYGLEYKIQRGDTLFLIGQRFGVTVQQLREANNISGDLIYAGDTITIPNQNNSQTYTVVRGDSLFFIAQRFNTTIQSLKTINNLTSDIIYPGQVLKITENTRTTTTTANRSTANRVFNVTDREMELLARAVYSEARGEPFEGQVAVAAVILNRVRHPEFPNTIEGVIFEPWAFTAVHDGQFWLTPNATAYKAVEEALRGVDPSNGAIFYYNPVTATNQWIRTRTIITRIGRHVFAI